MTKPILLLTLLFSGCICSSDVNTCWYISKEVRRDYYGTDLTCVDYSNEIERRCLSEGINVRQATFRASHRALVLPDGTVVDSTGFMCEYPLTIDELKVKGFRLEKPS